MAHRRRTLLHLVKWQIKEQNKRNSEYITHIILGNVRYLVRNYLSETLQDLGFYDPQSNQMLNNPEELLDIMISWNISYVQNLFKLRWEIYCWHDIWIRD